MQLKYGQHPKRASPHRERAPFHLLVRSPALARPSSLGNTLVTLSRERMAGRDGRSSAILGVMACYAGRQSRRPSQGVHASRSAPAGWGSSVRSSNPFRVRIWRDWAYGDGVTGERVKHRSEKPAPRSFGHPDDRSAERVLLGTADGIAYWIGRESGQRCRTLDCSSRNPFTSRGNKHAVTG